MDIFESLENLNVSEECFDEIMGIVEAVIDETLAQAIVKKHGKPEYEKDEDGNLKLDKEGSRIPANRSAELFKKAAANKNYEYQGPHNGAFEFSKAGGRGSTISGEKMKYLPKNINKHGWGGYGLYEYPGDRQTKSSAGNIETYYHRHRTNDPEKSGTDSPSTGYPYYHREGHDEYLKNTDAEKKKSDKQAIKASLNAFRKHMEKKMKK